MPCIAENPIWKKHAEKRQSLIDAHPLRYLFLEVTRRCNLSCAYCGSECEAGVDVAELGTEQWRGIIRQIAEDFDPSKIMIAVTGGEPLIRKDIYEIFGELRRAGFPFGMVSNGAFINRRTVSKLVESGIGSISLSYDAPDTINDDLRGSGAANNVEEAIRTLKEGGYKGILEIISTITRPAVPHLDTMRKRIAQLRVARWRMAPVMPVGRAAKRPDLLLNETEVRLLLNYIKASRRDDYKPTPEFSEEGFLGDEYEREVRPYRYRCNAGITVAGILHNGRIGACPELADCFVQGDTATDRFADVWHTRYQELRDRSWTKKGACDDCDAYSVCRGGALHLYRDTETAFDRCFYKMLCNCGCPAGS